VINETCSCGATFTIDIEDSPITEPASAAAWRANHRHERSAEGIFRTAPGAPVLKDEDVIEVQTDPEMFHPEERFPATPPEGQWPMGVAKYDKPEGWDK
jgi:hypothetical protein